MVNYWVIGILIIATILTIMSGVYCILAAEAIVKNSKYSSDANLNQAHWYLEVSAIVCWVTIFLILVGIGIYIYYSRNQASRGSTLIITGLMVLMVLLLAIMGSLSAAAAAIMHNSSNFSTSTSSDYEAYIDSIIVATLGVGGIGILLVGIIIYWYITHHRKVVLEKKEKIVVNAVSKAQNDLGNMVLEGKIVNIKNKILQDKLANQNLMQRLAIR
jgi:NADH:ubiquinone oxidoreductase subunit 5 (subunit L)/multisubunit Na+/H+ antiporter MnhA subunit